MNDFQFGLLGSIVYAGLTLGAGVATAVYSNPKRSKPTLITTLIMNAVCLCAFPMSPWFYLDAGLRLAIGFF